MVLFPYFCCVHEACSAKKKERPSCSYRTIVWRRVTAYRDAVVSPWKSLGNCSSVRERFPSLFVRFFAPSNLLKGNNIAAKGETLIILNGTCEIVYYIASFLLKWMDNILWILQKSFKHCGWYKWKKNHLNMWRYYKNFKFMYKM